MENAAERSALGVLTEDGGDGGGGGKQKSLAVEASSAGIEGETLWQMRLRASEPGGSRPYPQRPGASDCSHYLKTSYCRFGMRCKYNHPANRKLAAIVATIKGGYPERVGQLECQHYMRTGTCKYGAICKYHHPRDKAGKVQLNMLGYPLRPSERECTFYLRNGDCKFASTCKYHHPQPSNAMVALWGSPVYSSTTSPITLSQPPYPGGLMSWPLSGASFVSNPRSEDSSNYAQLVLPQGLLPIPSWDTLSSIYEMIDIATDKGVTLQALQGQSGGLLSPQSQQQAQGTFQYNGTPHQNETSMGAPGALSYISGSVPVNGYAVQKKNIFPERPDKSECQFYMKTGECKYGANCRYHHPRERVIPAPNCPLSPLGLPLRPGKSLCHFYTICGVCKFGPNCKFDHPMAAPMAILAYNLPTSDVPVVQSLLGSSSEPTVPALSSEAPVGASSGTV